MNRIAKIDVVHKTLNLPTVEKHRRRMPTHYLTSDRMKFIEEFFRICFHGSPRLRRSKNDRFDFILLAQRQVIIKNLFVLLDSLRIMFCEPRLGDLARREPTVGIDPVRRFTQINIVEVDRSRANIAAVEELFPKQRGVLFDGHVKIVQVSEIQEVLKQPPALHDRARHVIAETVVQNSDQCIAEIFSPPPLC